MNANADNHAENAELSPLEKLNSLIFDLGDTIPEGVYLEMMNHTKKLYDDMNKIKNRSLNFNIMTIEDKAMMIKNEDKLYILRRIQRREFEDLNIGVRFYEKDDLLFPIREGFKGTVIRLFSAGNTYKFMKITKINIKSIKYDILYITEGRQPRIKKDNKLKFQNGDYYDNLSSYSTKQILIYKTSNIVCNYFLNQYYLNWEDAETENRLTIWN
jgi:hypothetical protein